MKKLAARKDIGLKHVLEVELWDNQKELLITLETLLEQDKKVSFSRFHSPAGTQLNTFIIYASDEGDLAPYKKMPVRENRYDDDK